MTISDQIKTDHGAMTAEYHDASHFDALPYNQCTQVYGVCFYQDLIILAKTDKGVWILPGGSIEPGESYVQTLHRELREETNMKVLTSKPIGYQKLWNDHTPPIYQLRYYCQVELYGPFEKDMAVNGDIVSIWQILPSQVNELLNWRAIGDRIIKQAESIHSQSSKLSTY